MNRRIFFGIVLAAVVLMIGMGIGSNHDRGPQVITTLGGDPVVIPQPRSHFPLPFLIIPLVVVGLLAFARRGWGGFCQPGQVQSANLPANGDSLPTDDADRAAQWRAWHDAQHAESHSTPVPGA